MFRKHKKIIVITMLVAVSLILAYTFAEKQQALAEKNIVDAVESYLENHGVSCRSVTKSGQIIMVELNSHGTGRCTLEDIKALQILNEAIQCDQRLDNIQGIQVSIYDSVGALIYDAYTAKNVSHEDGELTQEDMYRVMSKEILKEKAETIMEEYPCTMGEPFYTEQDTGISKLEVDVDVKQEDIISMLNISDLICRASVEFEGSGLSQFIVNMKTDDGECFLYVIVDLVANEGSAWVSPEVQDDFAIQEEPASTSEK